MKKQLKEKFKKEHSDYIQNIIKNNNSVDFEIEQDWVFNWLVSNLAKQVYEMKEDCRNDGGIQYLSTYENIIDELLSNVTN